MAVRNGRGRRVRRGGRRRDRAQGMVEFALVFPVALLIIMGMIAGSWLFFASEAVQDGARGGARAGVIETSLWQPSGTLHCESQQPESIAQSVQHSVTVITVNQQQLCTTGPADTTTLVQASSPANEANITVVACPSLANPVTVQVTVTFRVHGLAPPFQTMNYTMTSTSLQPVLTAGNALPGGGCTL